MKKRFLTKITALLLAVIAFTFTAASCKPKDPDTSSPTSSSGKPNDSSKPGDSSKPDDSGTKPDDDDKYEGVVGKEYILTHEGDGKVTYVFEAENTCLDGKKGVGYSGQTTGKSMVVGIEKEYGASGNQMVSYLYYNGTSVNFFIVSDREVENATLTVRLSAEFLNLVISPANYGIRVDPVEEKELAPVAEGGSWGDWEKEFLNYYNGAPSTEDDPHGPFNGYYINDWACDEIHMDARENGTFPMKFQDFKITADLKLYKGVTCISFITANSEVPTNSSGKPLGTLAAIAPLIDCIKITTEAQLGMFRPVANDNSTANACYIQK